MRLYLAGADSGGDHLPLDGLPNLAFLVSFWYILRGKGWDVINYAIARSIPLFLDSGAYSAMTLGEPVSLSAYIDFCLEHGSKFQVMASLDVIGDWRATLSNHLQMRAAGLPTIPAFHVREPFDYLALLLKDHDYIALGVAGMQHRRNALGAWLTECFRLRSVINPACRFHGFALTSDFILRAFPWHSVDSTSWILNGRGFGRVYVQDGPRMFTIRPRVQPRARSKYYRQIKDVLVPRTSDKHTYDAVLRHNADVMLQWTAALPGREV